MKIRIFFISIFLASSAFAEPLENFLGWDLTKNTTESSPTVNEDGSYTVSSRGDYYTLTPPDRRAPVSVDAITASRLRAGQADPERVYSGGAASPAAAQASGGGDGPVPAGTFAPLDDLKTTAPMTEGGILAYPVAPPRQESQASSSSGSSGLGGGVSSGGSTTSNAAKYAAASSAIPDNGYDGVKESAKELAAAQAAAAAAVGGVGMPLVRPNPVAATETDKNFSNDVNKAQAEALGFKTPTDKDGKPVGALKPVDEFGGTVGGNKQMAGFGFNGNKEGKNGKEVYSAPAVCTGGSKVFDKPGAHRLSIPRGCTNLTISAWGAGGGKGHSGGSGGGAAFSMGRSDFDGSQFDVIVVVGAAGESGNASKPGLGGFPGGGTGGGSSIGPGGGGGGYSGVFKVHKNNRENIFVKENAILIAAGGGGGGGYGTTQTVYRGNNRNSAGGNGGVGNTNEAAGNSGNGQEGASLLGGHGGDGNTETSIDCDENKSYQFGIKRQNCGQNTYGAGYYYNNRYETTYRRGGGGGGGGGFIGGGGGGTGGSGGGGGSCLAAPLVPILAAGKGTKPGYEHFPDRGRAGEAGQHGKVKVEF